MVSFKVSSNGNYKKISLKSKINENQGLRQTHIHIDIYTSDLTYNSSNINNLMLELERKRFLFIKENCLFFTFGALSMIKSLI